MQLSPAKGELCNPSGSPALWYKDMYWNKKQRKGLVNKLILEDLNPLLLPCYTDDQKKAMREPSWKAPWKKKLSFALANSVTKSNYLHIFKPWTDHIHLKTGTFLPARLPFCLTSPIQERGRERTLFLWRGRTSRQQCHLHNQVTTSLAAHARKFPFPVQALVWLMQLQQRQAQALPHSNALTQQCTDVRTGEKGAKIFSVKTHG